MHSTMSDRLEVLDGVAPRLRAAGEPASSIDARRDRLVNVQIAGLADRVFGPHAPETAPDDVIEVIHETARRFGSLGELVYELLKEGIRSGALPPGARLPQERLADAMGVSRVPVRQALVQLEADGLVDMQGRGGAIVQRLSERQIRDVFEVRIALETFALERAMNVLRGERLDRLVRLAARVDQSEPGPNFLAERGKFLREIYDAEGNPALWESIEHLRLKVGRYMLELRVPGHRAGSHGVLTDAIARGDTEAAVAILRKHLVEVREGLIDLMEGDH